MFSPPKDYDFKTQPIFLKEFYDYKEQFILRPPYQRHANIWPQQKRQSFLDSICRGYYIPAIVLRKVRMSEDKTKFEVIDGQQRITTIQMFYDGELELPQSLKSMTRGELLIRRRYSALEWEQRQWFDKLSLEADVINNIEDRTASEHLKKASDIFWRLQLGEPLTFMERQHARVYSGARNFVAKYADDATFDYDKYNFEMKNADRHPFFGKIISMKNDRMQHLLLLARLLLLEANNGPTELNLKAVDNLFDKYAVSEVTDCSFENRKEAKSCLRVLNKFSALFEKDLLAKGESSIRELKDEYFIVSLYLLLRHLDEHYVFGESQYSLLRDFVSQFYQRYKKDDPDDKEMSYFRDHRRQAKDDIEARDLIVRAVFFSQHPNLFLKDSKRSFDEAQRIAIYRGDKGLCKMCLDQGKPEKEAFVPWSQYNADHIVAHIKGGLTLEKNAQVLCSYHNKQKGGK